MTKTLPLKREESKTVRHELTVDELINQSKKILEIREKVMKENVHYGVIPGCSKPSLWKPGAEKLCSAFRLEPGFETTQNDDPNRTIKWEKWDYENRKNIEGTTYGYMEYNSRCRLTHIPTGDVWASNVGASCNNFEAKYRSLSPYEVKNTLEKMSEKRSLVAAVLIGTAASDIFTQDIEDLPYLIKGEDKAPGEKAGNESNNKTSGNNDNGSVRMATDKQIVYIKRQLKQKKISQTKFFEEWEEEFDSSWDSIPMSEVNDILEWIREQ